MAQSTAWLIDLGGGHRAAVGEREMAHVAAAPVSLHAVPGTPSHCRQILTWERKLVPVLDLGGWLNGTTATFPRNLFGIIKYQASPGDALQHGALPMAGLPSRIVVDDVQACELPSEPVGWRGLAISCFELRGTPIPILNLPRIFSDPLTDTGR